MQLLDVFVIASSVLTAPFTVRAGRRWTAASQVTLAMLFAVMLWGRSGARFDTFALIVSSVLLIALLVLTVMSLRELRREMHKPR
jgi:hypothetical protein